MDRALVEEARKSDREAFAVLVRLVSDSIFAVTATTLTLGPGGPVTFRVKPWTRVGP